MNLLYCGYINIFTHFMTGKMKKHIQNITGLLVMISLLFVFNGCGESGNKKLPELDDLIQKKELKKKELDSLKTELDKLKAQKDSLDQKLKKEEKKSD